MTERYQVAIPARLLPSFTDFAFLVPIVFLFGRMDGMQTLLGDCDTGWHIRTGQWIFAQSLAFPCRTLFLYQARQTWFAWEWLSDIVLAGCNPHGRPQAVALFAILMLCALLRPAVTAWCGANANPVVAIGLTMVARGGLLDSLAGTPAPVHAVVSGAFLRGAGSDPRRIARGLRRTWLLLFPLSPCSGPTCTADFSSAS